MILSSFGKDRVSLDLIPGEKLMLCCWCCGKKIEVGNEELNAGKFNIWSSMKRNGWVGKADFERRSVLMFCSEVCSDNCIGADGRYKYRKAV